MQFWRIPVRYWPTRWHAIAACGTILLVLGAAFGVLVHVRSNTQNLRLTYQQQEAELQHLASMAAAQSSAQNNPLSEFAKPGVQDAVARDITRFAQDIAVVVQTLSLRPRESSTTELGQYSFALQAKAPYMSFKTWLAELLARYPSLAVRSLTLSAAQPVGSVSGLPAVNPVTSESGLIDITLELVLYVQ